MDKGRNNGIICLLSLTVFLLILKAHKIAPTDVTEFGLWIAGAGAIRYGYIFIKNEIEFQRTKRRLIRNGKKYRDQNTNKKLEQQKNNRLVIIMLCLVVFAYTGKTYNQTPNISTLFYTIGSFAFLMAAIISYIKLKLIDRPKRIKPTKRAITPFDKKFKKNYAKTQRKQKPDIQIPDNKTAYIESAWDELNKI